MGAALITFAQQKNYSTKHFGDSYYYAITCKNGGTRLLILAAFQ